MEDFGKLSAYDKTYSMDDLEALRIAATEGQDEEVKLLQKAQGMNNSNPSGMTIVRMMFGKSTDDVLREDADLHKRIDDLLDHRGLEDIADEACLQEIVDCQRRLVQIHRAHIEQMHILLTQMGQIGGGTAGMNN